MTPLWFAITSLAIYRLVRLWLYDVIAEPLRARVIGDPQHLGVLRWPNAFTTWLVDLLTCQWCLGIWVSFATVLALGLCGVEPYDWSPLGVTLAIITALALAAVQSFWHLLEDLVGTLTERLDGSGDQPS